MSLRNNGKILTFDHLMLLPVAALAFYVAFIPHLNYAYALHVDEWLHLSFAKAMLRDGSVTFTNPFFGAGKIGVSTYLEASFNLFWGVFQAVSGIPWMIIFRYFPSIIFVITILTVYILADREGFGWEAAFFTCLIPTTVGILGPALLVPVALGLLFTPLILFLVFNFRDPLSYLLLFVLIGFLLAIHAPSAISPIIVLAPYMLLNLKGNFKHSLGMILALLLPFLVIFPWIFNLLLPTARSLFIEHSASEFVQLPRIIENYGYLPVLVCLLGTIRLALKGDSKSYGLVLGLLALLLMLVAFFTFHRGVPIMYERGLMYMMLMLSIVAGAGLATIKNLELPARFSDWLRVPPFVTENVGRFLSLVLVGVILAIAIPARLGTPYYLMIDTEDYHAFVWIKNNLAGEYNRAIVDPWKATAFNAITDRHIYTRVHNYPTAIDEAAYAFIRGGSRDTAFLRQNGISIIYTRVYEGKQGQNIEYPSQNPQLIEVAKNIYVLK